MKHAMTLYQQNIADKGTERTVINCILEQQQQTKLTSQKKTDQKTAAAAYSSKGWRTRHTLSMLDGKRLVQCLIGHDTAKKGKKKKNRSRSPIKKRDDSAERQCVRKTGQNASGKEHRPPCFNCTTGTHCHDREGKCWHPPALETRQEK